MTARTRRALRRDDGASAVEFALVVPLLIILVFGIIAFGIVLAQQQALSNAAREGARYGAVNLFAQASGDPRTCSSVVTKVRAVASTVGMNSADVAVTISRDGTSVCSSAAGSATVSNATTLPCVGGTTSSRLTVETDYESSLVIPLVIADPTFGLTGNGVYRCEYTSTS
jgi:Flp pilus assembly protein TadG